MIIRSATACDATSIYDLLVQLGYHRSVESLAAALDRMSANGFDEAFVAEQDGRIVGCIALHAHELFHVEGRLGRITAFIVDAAAQGRGVGTALIAAAQLFFEKTACIKIEVTSGDHRQSAHRFYRARGFQLDERRFLKLLDKTTSSRSD